MSENIKNHFIANTSNSMKYQWADGCFGYHYLQEPGLSVIREEMTPNTTEVLHYHNFTQQFFYILRGTATFILGTETLELSTDEGIHIEPGKTHAIQNKTSLKLKFLVISEPPVKDDRINIASL